MLNVLYPTVLVTNTVCYCFLFDQLYIYFPNYLLLYSFMFFVFIILLHTAASHCIHTCVTFKIIRTWLGFLDCLFTQNFEHSCLHTVIALLPCRCYPATPLSLSPMSAHGGPASFPCRPASLLYARQRLQISTRLRKCKQLYPLSQRKSNFRDIT